MPQLTSRILTGSVAGTDFSSEVIPTPATPKASSNLLLSRRHWAVSHAAQFSDFQSPHTLEFFGIVGDEDVFRRHCVIVP
jgi:hypothetical protein